MKLLARAALTAGAVAMLGTVEVSAQLRVVPGFGGGVIFPSNFGDDANTGYVFTGMVGFRKAASKIAFRVEGQYGSVKYDGLPGQTKPRDRIFNATGSLVFLPGNDAAAVRPYLLGGAGYYSFDYDDGQAGVAADVKTTGLGGHGGAGLLLGKGPRIVFFVEGRYVYTEDHRYIPVTAGVRINTGNVTAQR